MTEDEKFMRAALSEAVKGIGNTSPNPAVGAVIVRNRRIVGRGWHRRAGEPHAEIEAIQSLKKREYACGATMYVTLEPCSTYGRTPPCCDAIREHGFARVVVGAIDPNPRHAGRGMELLRGGEIDVQAGVLGVECESINRPFNKWIVTRMPWVIAKAGMSLDGRLTRPPGEGQWITSPASRRHAMQLRTRVDAILIGGETVRSDNPRLTIRGIPGFEDKQPWRVVLTKTGNLPKTTRLFTDSHRDRTLVYRGQSLRSVLRDLGKRQVTSVLIEGGGRTLAEAFDRKLVDEVRFYIAPLLCGGPRAIGGRGAGSSQESILLKDVRYVPIGDDIHLTAYT